MIRQAQLYTNELLVGSAPLILAVVLAYNPAISGGAPLLPVMLCLFSSSLLQISHEVLRLCNLGVRKELKDYLVPLHTEYLVHRYGEVR